MGPAPLTPPPGLPPLDAEWLEADGAGGFASGTVGGMRTRRYHALLLTATAPPSGRVVLVNGLEAWVDTRDGTTPLSTQYYGPDVVYPRGRDHLVGFALAPWPQWRFALPDGTTIDHHCLVSHGDGAVVLRWRTSAGTGVSTGARLRVRLLLSGRDFHALMRENAAFNFNVRVEGGNACWRPYAALPPIAALSNGAYAHQPDWYRNFLYTRERERGLDCREDLGSPGIFSFDLARGDAVLVLRADDALAVDAVALAARVGAEETARRSAATPLERAAECYFARRGDGHTIIAGYPWFGDWGRDTFIALRGLALARGRLERAESILLAWSVTVSEGMLPNRFPDHGEAPEYNAVDASLWYVVAVHAFLDLAAPSASVRSRLLAATTAILTGYAHGTRFGIRMDDDGLLACGVPGVQLTWMDARVGERVVTPRIGKPVEVQALWINALRLAGDGYAAMADRASGAFRQRFPNPGTGCLFDVVDADHVPHRDDPSVRPNQLFAIGGLPHSLVDDATARAILAVVERDLVTPAGVRTLSPADPAYCGHYAGDAARRDAAYHQGTAWPWLVGALVDAWLRVHGDDDASRAEARRRFLEPLQAHFAFAGLDHVGEIADGDAPHAPNGCPFQAWSVGELLWARARTAPARAPAVDRAHG